ncbi:glycerophosphodiester phosphodiesterase family protein [Gleimia hominis]|uniref:Glycerophosphodiester phosphodiesterase family protein n=1 Tax=Gleimia hominis TaxID=595468 RepID=A0ABU3I9Y7_9ACTO|nr:glycerophosphodiester phosphodiesterase family protein [Gleimia hominis]MDT3767028.1 glycerophosphodiester phosphodiesterase family protein [Gleimia hominis]
MDFPKVIAHRGVSSLAPENTIAAFSKCIEVGVPTFEFDVDIMGDGTLIVIHDDKFDRTTNGKGGFYNKGFSDLRKLDAGGWFSRQYRFEPVPELASVISLMNSAQLDANLEIKPCRGGTRLRDALVEGISVSLRELDADRQLLISSFDLELLQGVRSIMPQARLACLYDPSEDFLVSPGEERVDAWIRHAKVLGAEAIHPSFESLREHEVERMRDAGFDVNVWTVNEVSRAVELAQWGANAVITDRPQDFPEEVRQQRL